MKTLKKVAQTQETTGSQKPVPKPGKTESALPPDMKGPHPGMQLSSLGKPTESMATAHKKIIPTVGMLGKPPKMKVPKPPKLAALKDIPNYRKAKDLRKCSNCAHFSGGLCEKFDAGVQPEMTCDDWTRK